ncbi:MAG: DUF932 domain-containing protein [SAR324 cluster bacterium]|nr:DUF932 domain-containing protein [SAR324 cluster bacterium]
MLHYQPIQTHHFKNLEDLKDYTSDEQKHIQRVPLKNLLDSKSCFNLDTQFMNLKTGFTFNEAGIKSLCQTVGVPFNLLTRLQGAGLASDVLNDVFAQPETLKKLQNQHLVVDDRTNQILCLVSQSYRNYSNFSFLEDLLETGFKDNEFSFQEAVVSNTNLVLRTLSPKVKGCMKQRDGSDGEDVTTLGLQLRNSMVGESSVFAEYYTLRRICGNGMTVKVGGNTTRVYHSGKQSSFAYRLNTQIGKAIEGFEQVLTMIRTLGALEFRPRKLAELKAPVFEVLPQLKEASREINAFYSRNDEERESRLINDHSALIETIPEQFGGETSACVFNSPFRTNASLWDFLNVFTEHAKTLDHSERLDVEEKVGQLSVWCANHQTQLN